MIRVTRGDRGTINVRDDETALEQQTLYPARFELLHQKHSRRIGVNDDCKSLCHNELLYRSRFTYSGIARSRARGVPLSIYREPRRINAFACRIPLKSR